jgi:hypothetical protein
VTTYVTAQARMPAEPNAAALVMRPMRACCLRDNRKGCEPWCDARFVIDSMLKANRADRAWRDTPAQAYYSVNRQWIHELLSRSDVTVVIASAPADDHRIQDYAVVSPAPPLPLPVIHFVLVRNAMREKKLVWRMLEHVGVKRDGRVLYTAKPPSAARLVRSFKHATYCPLSEFLRP